MKLLNVIKKEIASWRMKEKSCEDGGGLKVGQKERRKKRVLLVAWKSWFFFPSNLEDSPMFSKCWESCSRLFSDCSDPPGSQVRALHALGRGSGSRHQGGTHQGERHGLLHTQGPRGMRAESQGRVLQGRRWRRCRRIDSKKQLGEERTFCAYLITFFPGLDYKYVQYSGIEQTRS